MPVDEVTLAPNLEAVLFTPAVGKRGRHVDAFQTYHDFYKDELHIPQRRFDAGRLPTATRPLAGRYRISRFPIRIERKHAFRGSLHDQLGQGCNCPEKGRRYLFVVL